MKGNIRKIASLFKATKTVPSVDKFFDRLKIQKASYIFQAYGIELGYKFGFYVKGVYSPDLADDYYQHQDEFNSNTETEPLTQDEHALAVRVAEILDKPNVLEAVTSLIYFQKNKSADNIDAAMILTKGVKPYLTDSDFAVARAFLEKQSN